MSLLHIQHDAFHQAFPGKGFLIQHELVNSGLFKLPRLIELANSLPSSSIEYKIKLYVMQ